MKYLILLTLLTACTKQPKGVSYCLFGKPNYGVTCKVLKPTSSGIKLEACKTVPKFTGEIDIHSEVSLVTCESTD